MSRLVSSATRIVRRIDRSLSGPLNLFNEQFMYGHREILVAYTGLPFDTALKGSIDHGWIPWGPNLGVPRIRGGRYLHLAWSSECMKRSNREYPNSVVPVGAPFLYLNELLKSKTNLQTREHSRRFLFMPGHGGEASIPDIEGQISQYSEIFDPSKSSAVLYWTEFLDAKVRQTYESAGFRVVCAGFGGNSSNSGLGIMERSRAISGIGGRHLFLYTLYQELVSHDVVVHGLFGTSTLYSGLLHKETVLLPGWNTTDFQFTENVSFSQSTDARIAQYVTEEVVPRYFSAGGLAKDNFYVYCEQELGVRNMLSEHEARDLIAQNSFSAGSMNTVAELIQTISKAS